MIESTLLVKINQHHVSQILAIHAKCYPTMSVTQVTQTLLGGYNAFVPHQLLPYSTACNGRRRIRPELRHRRLVTTWCSLAVHGCARPLRSRRGPETCGHPNHRRSPIRFNLLASSTWIKFSKQISASASTHRGGYQGSHCLVHKCSRDDLTLLFRGCFPHA